MRRIATLLAIAAALGGSVAYAAHNITLPTGRMSITRLVVQSLTIHRGSNMTYEVTLQSAGTVLGTVRVTTTRANRCGGLRYATIGPPGEMETYTKQSTGCRAALRDAFVNTVGNVATKMNAFEDQLNTLGLVPPGT